MSIFEKKRSSLSIKSPQKNNIFNLLEDIGLCFLQLEQLVGELFELGHFVEGNVDELHRNRHSA